MMKKDDLSSEIIFYCKDCEDIVETFRVGGKYVYKCKKCGTKNVAFGTKRSVYGFFRLEEKEAKEAKKKLSKEGQASSGKN